MFALFSNQFVIYLLVLSWHEVDIKFTWCLPGAAWTRWQPEEERRGGNVNGEGEKNTVAHVNECESLQRICGGIFLSAVKRGVVSSENTTKREVVADGDVFSFLPPSLKSRGRCKLQDLRDHLDKEMFTPEISTWRLSDILLKKKNGSFLFI